MRTGVLLFALVLSLGWAAACQRSRANEKRYELKGKVVAVEKNKRLVTIAHEDIKGYMPGMVMPFAVKDDRPLENLVQGDQVQATLVVDGSASWLEDVFVTRESADTSYGSGDGPTEARAGDELPNFSLVNQDGKPVHLQGFRGQTLLLTFIYTRCPQPDQCNLMSDNFNLIDRELQKQPDAFQKTHLLSVSFDSDYDTPAVLRSYGAAHTGKYSEEKFDHWEFASGNADQIKGLAQFFGMRYFHDTQSGQDQIVHSLRTAIIGPDGKVYKVYRGNEWKPDEILRELKSVVEKNP